INGLVFDRHEEERNVQVFLAALRASIEEFLQDPLGTPLVPNWARVWAGVPEASARLLSAVAPEPAWAPSVAASPHPLGASALAGPRGQWGA
ncbi:MAG TPA: hypothetical protein VI589_10735, partial [Vicinamibacteria bacterium]